MMNATPVPPSAPTNMTSAVPPGAAADHTSRPRLLYIDNLRIWLITLVMLHHLAITYGRSGPWYYLVPHTPPAATAASLVFVLMNQAYFMGLFFGVSAYFTPGSVDRKGNRQFIRDRALRLGIPLAIFVLVLNPLANLYSKVAEPGPYTLHSYLTSLGFGPLWFVEVLIIFTAVYLAVRRNRPAPRPRDESLRGRSVIIFAAGLVVATYLWRILLPFGGYVPYLDLASAYELPQYASFFVIGILAYRRGWLHNLPSRFGVIGGIVAGGLTVLLAPIVMISLSQLSERGSWQSAVYALWEQSFAVGFGLATLVFFRRFANHQSALAAELSRAAFPAYVVHAPVITGVAIALQPLGLPVVISFALAAVIGIPLTFAIAAAVRRLPGLRRIF